MAQVYSHCRDSRGQMTGKMSVIMHVLNGHFEGEISCGQYGFSG